MTLIEMTLEAAIKSAGKYEDVRLTHEEANAILELLKKNSKKNIKVEEEEDDD